MEIIVNTENETEKAATDLAASISHGDIILLHGTLGMGKTVFARALIRTLTGQTELDVPSPTFTLVQTYETPACPLYHYDLYRIEDPDEIFELGWEDALSEGITIVEWPERLGPYKPERTLDITLSSVENNQDARQILIERKN